MEEFKVEGLSGDICLSFNLQGPSLLLDREDYKVPGLHQHMITEILLFAGYSLVSNGVFAGLEVQLGCPIELRYRVVR